MNKNKLEVKKQLNHYFKLIIIYFHHNLISIPIKFQNYHYHKLLKITFLQLKIQNLKISY